jgi:hypothetical protein
VIGRAPLFRVPAQSVLVEVVAEEVADRGWTMALVERLVPYGDVYFRFVARERGPGLRVRRTLFTGEPFPVARPGLHDVAAQGAWLDVQTTRLLELQGRLADDGWEPVGRGEHWWSVRYAPPAGRGPDD